MNDHLEQVSATMLASIKKRGLRVSAFDGHDKRVHFLDPAAIRVRVANENPYYTYSVKGFAGALGYQLTEEEAKEIEGEILKQGRKRSMSGAI